MFGFRRTSKDDKVDDTISDEETSVDVPENLEATQSIPVVDLEQLTTTSSYVDDRFASDGLEESVPHDADAPQGINHASARRHFRFSRALIILLLVAGLGVAGGLLAFTYFGLQQTVVEAKGFIEYARRSTQDPSDLLYCASDQVSFEAAGDIDVTQVGMQELPVRITNGPFSKEVTVGIWVKDTQPPVISLAETTLNVEMGEKLKESDVVDSVVDPVDGEFDMVTAEPKALGTSVGEEVVYSKGWYLVDGLESTSKAGSYMITVIACDKHGNRSSETLDLTVEDPLADAKIEAKTSVLEYSKKPIDPVTLVTCSVPEATIEASTLDLSTVGEKKVTYKLSKGGSTKKISHTFTVRDTKEPMIQIDKSAVAIDAGESFDPYGNVKSVTDEVDGDLQRVESVPDDPSEGWYTIEGEYDANTPSKYFLTVVACDKNGNRTDKEFSLEVKEPPVQTTPTSADPGTPAATQSNEHDYVCNRNTHKFHYPSCGDVKRISDEHRWDVHMTREGIIGMGFAPCAHCNP